MRQPVIKRLCFTLIEMLVTITIIVVAASLVIPQLRDDSRLRLIAASQVLASDIEMAQVMSMSSPDKAVVVRFDPGNDKKYWLAYASDPTTPIQLPDTQYDYVVVLGEGPARGAIGVTISLSDVPGDVLGFNALGGIDDPTTLPEITMMLDGRWIKLSIAPTTGTITESASP